MKVFITLLIFASVSAQASTVARVLEIKGKAFAFNGDSSPRVLKYGDKVEDLSDVMVEDSSYLSLVNTEGHVFHVTGGTLLKLYKKNIELKNGQLWTVAKEAHRKGALSTSNGLVEYDQGQFVLSYDNISGKTQVLVITGKVKFANSLEPALNADVAAGTFSIIDPEYENNLPRTPTLVGAESFRSLRKNFAGFDSLDDPSLNKMLPQEESSGRSIASVVEGYTKIPTKKARGKLITITSHKGSRKPASAMSYYMKLKNKRSKSGKKVLATAPVRYFGWKPSNKIVIKTNKVQKATKVQSPKRMPASIPASSASGPGRLINELKKSPFDKSLELKKDSNKRHSDEVNFLIDSLKSYKKDFQKEY